MLAKWLTKLAPVHVARTREEYDAIYRFRYEVYWEEFGRQLGNPDHERRMLFDDHDEQDFSTILYTGTLDNISGTVRLRHWAPGAVPEYELRELSMDVIPDVGERHTAEIGRFMIRKSLRGGKLILASFARESYDLLCGEKGSELAFCYCAPGLVPFYRKLGARPFGGRLVQTPDGMMMPLVAVISDHDYYKSVGSPLAPMVKRHFGSGKRPPVDVEPYRHLFENEGIESDAEKMWGELQDAVVGEEEEATSFLQAIPEPLLRRLADRGFIMQVDSGMLVTRQDYAEEEMYLILDGTFEAVDASGQRLAVMEKGELFGELAFFVPGSKRTASVKATTEGRVLVLRGKTLRKLIDSDPAAAAQLLLKIGAVMAGRLASGTG